MSVDYEIVVPGSNACLPEGGLGLANLTLVHTGGGPMLFDVGHVPNRHRLISVLAERSLKPSDVTRVFLSHLHIDHVLNIDLFPYSTQVFVSRAEWDYVHAPHENDESVPWLIREQLGKYDLRLLDDEGEFEPGLRYILVPGHTPGCMALVLDADNKGRVVIAGDAIKNFKEVIRQACDSAYDSRENGTRSIRRILAMADRIVPGHFSEFVREGGVFVWDEPVQMSLILR